MSDGPTWPTSDEGSGADPRPGDGAGSGQPQSDPTQSGPPTQPPPPPTSPGSTPAAAPAGTNADYGQRVIAYLIDAAVFIAAFVLVMIVSAIVGLVSDTLGWLVGLLGYLAIIGGSIAYFIVSEGGPLGQTLGKHLQGIRVVGADGESIDKGRAGIRWLGRILDTIVCGLPIGLLWPLWDDQDRTWHDMVATTRVVRTETPEQSLQYWMNNVRG